MNSRSARCTPWLILPLWIAATQATSVSAADLPDPLEAGWRGAKTCEKLHEDEKARVIRCIFPPEVGHERHFHAPHYVYVLSGGKIRITDSGGTRDIDIPTGTFGSNPRIEWHEGLNVGDSTLQYLIFEPKPSPAAKK